jgi:phosphoglycolate phosphatase
MAKYKLIIFDFDGTLVDSYPWFQNSFNLAAKKFRFKEVQEYELETLRSLDSKGIIKYLGVSWWKIPFIASYMRRKFNKEVQLILPFKGHESLLQDLHERGLSLALVTSNSLINVHSILDKEVLKYFHALHCNVSLFGKRKIYKILAKKFQYKPSQCLCIGDECRDIEAAEREGMSSGAVLWGYAAPDALRSKKPTYIFKKFEDILNVVK